MAQRTIWVKGDPTTNTLGDCPFSHRALLTLENKKLEYTKEFVDFADKPQWIVEKADGKVPVLKDGEKLVPDSGAICEYLEMTYPDPSLKSEADSIAPKLLPSFVGVLGATSDDPELDEKQATLKAQLSEIETYLTQKSSGPFLGGGQMCCGDCLIAPRLHALDKTLQHYKSMDMLKEFPKTKGYLESVRSSKPWKNTQYSDEFLLGEKGWKSKVPKEFGGSKG